MNNDPRWATVGTHALSAQVSPDGRLIGLSKGDRHVSVTEEGWAVKIDGRVISIRDAAAAPAVSRDGGRLCYTYPIDGGRFVVDIEYACDDEVAALYRTLSIRCKDDTWVDEVAFVSLAVAGESERFEVRTLHEAPFASLGRTGHLSVLTGIQNPHLIVELKHGHSLSYQPAMRLAAGATFRASPQFFALVIRDETRIESVAPRTRVAVGERFNRGRFRDPSADRPLSVSETRIAQAVVRQFLQPLQKNFKFILYTYWLPLPRLPKSDEDVAIWLRTIDNFVDLGGDLLLAVPLTNAAPPTLADDSFWELEPPGSHAAHIMDYARSKGLHVGYYMGVAAGNLPFSNAPALGTPDQSPDAWRKVNADGSLAHENCLADAGYAAWLGRVTRNTIAKYGLAAWSWDPGPGHGRFCNCHHHGHRPGQGAHLGWLRAQDLLAGLHDTFDDLHIQGFYGQKEDGTWGQRWISQHEGYWEQQIEWGASIYPDASTERQNGNGVRLQAWKSLNFRFLPPEMNHALAGRMTQMCLDSRELVDIFDHWGWEFGLKSAIATGGSLVASTLPPENAAPEIRHRYRQWVEWARRNWVNAGKTRASGHQVELGGVDAFIRVDSSGGTVFLSNPGPRPVTFKLDLSEILPVPFGDWGLIELSPDRGRQLEATGKSLVFDGDGTFDIVVPPMDVLVAAVDRVTASSEAPRGRSSPVRSRVYPIDDWTDATAGGPFSYPRHSAMATASLKASVMLSPWRELPPVQAANARDLRALNPNFPDVFSYVDPDRVYLIVPLQEPDSVGGIELRIDNNPVAGEWYDIAAGQTLARFPEAAAHGWRDVRVVWHADITDAIPHDGKLEIDLRLTDLPGDQFLGPWLQVPAFVEVPSVRSRLSSDALTDARSPRMDVRVDAHLVSAEVDGPLGQHATFRIRAAVASPENVDAVFASNIVGAGVMFDLCLNPVDVERRVWEREVRIEERAAIILDTDHITVWVRSTSGHVGNSIRIPVYWTLPRARDGRVL
jgi:hypothetical protein